MSDNIRQEAVEQVAAKVGLNSGNPAYFTRQIEEVIDASGLIEQLTEAIAQRDLAHSANAELGASFQEARRDALRLRKQLAAESALCDRLVVAFRPLAPNSQAVAVYDAHRASEHREP